MVFDPASVGFTASCRRPIELWATLRVTCRPPLGAGELSKRTFWFSRCAPTVAPLLIPRVEAVTDACTEAGEYPVALAVMMEVPRPTGWNVVVPEEEPPPIVTGEVVMVPTLFVPL